MHFPSPRHELLPHLDTKTCLVPVTFYRFKHGHVLRATMACNFSSFLWVSWLRTRRFGKPKFRPARARKHWKNKYFAIFLHFCLLFSSRLFSSLTFSSDFLLCLSSAHIVRSLTSKLPPIIHMYIYIEREREVPSGRKRRLEKAALTVTNVYSD